MTPETGQITQIFRRRISRRVAFWVFVSIVVIEAILLVPSVLRQEQELVDQLTDQVALKMTWLIASQSPPRDLESTTAEGKKILANLQKMSMKNPTLDLLGGDIYDYQGHLLASFGDRPTLNWQDIQGGEQLRKNWHDLELGFFDPEMSGYTVVLRHSMVTIRQELSQYTLRITFLVVIISIFVTASTMAVMQHLVITPVLELREDLQTAGDLVIRSPEKINIASLHSLSHQRDDELGDVMDEFQLMLTRITSEIKQRIQAEQDVRQEQEKSEELLLNILPASVAQSLKENRRHVAEGFSDVSVLFADLVGFTALSAQRSPAEVVTLLNDIFSSFDRLSEIYGLEKIKTIGDAYMVAGGLPLPKLDHAESMANMALEMLTEIERLNGMLDYKLELRIGIHCGSVVAGVIGTRKFIYDLWGDAVNVASRMESQGTPGKIQVTADFIRKLGDRYQFEARGEIEVKGKGMMKTYFLLGKSA